ncbi:g4625 [Coccomyxa viridis]|uniref:Ubiquitin carboxyl-terminal hydrolase n=1 Tax=Coccomyxa viridis TaxID=1274662 RepID=A0ABP1FQT5_9CHLO
MGKKWLPLESNPDVLNDFSTKLGLDTSQYSFHDVYGMDPELLAMLPQPVIALLLLFPITDQSEAASKAEADRLRDEGYTPPKAAYFMKQTIGNACGTMGVLHALANNLSTVSIDDGSFLQRFYEATADMDPAQRGAYLEHPPEGAPDIDEAHHAAAQAGETRPPGLDEVVALHFVALVQREGRLLELDGRKPFPIDHGSSSPATLLQDAVKVAQRFMESNGSIQFNLIALCAGLAAD